VTPATAPSPDGNEWTTGRTQGPRVRRVGRLVVDKDATLSDKPGRGSGPAEDPAGPHPEGNVLAARVIDLLWVVQLGC